jgi:hypothetical protein
MDLLGIVGVASGSVAIPLSAVSTATSIAAISQGVSAQQAASDAAGGGGGGGGDPKEDPRLAKFSLRVSCPDVRELDGKIVVLRNGKVRRLLILFPIAFGLTKCSSTWTTRTRHIGHSKTATRSLASTSIIR